MAPADWLVVGEWAAAVGLMLVLAWEPWLQMRGHGAVDLSDETIGRAVSPGYVFVLPLLAIATPLVEPFVLGPGATSLWRQPHLLLPGVAAPLVLVVVLQAYLCRRVLAAARRRSETLAEKREVLAKGAARSEGRKP